MPRRATKIVATLGPASSDPALLEQMIRAGVNVVRLNFSHGKAQDHIDRARLVREAAQRAGREVAIAGNANIRDFACTFLGAILGKSGSRFIQIGDGQIGTKSPQFGGAAIGNAAVVGDTDHQAAHPFQHIADPGFRVPDPSQRILKLF